ncbi:cysteine-rich CWC family protein [Silvimonas iriomotensis]|uniref:cysteine-rich CWC family protein n=1 Tax=Silvimonas iriomotensis TaxID=449662 RepID=UPI001664A408|nr:cysteine-rich CWC family protein [Silvimonas iriomotensis]
MTSSPASALDPSRCPACGAPNSCAATRGEDPATCWCMVVMPDAAAPVKPAGADNQACLCPRCLTGAAD